MLKKDKRISDYVCFDCGKIFIKEKTEGNIVTCHIGICGLCQEEKSITHIRAFNYLEKEKKKKK